MKVDLNRARGAILGLAVGDAVGTTNEFTMSPPPIDDMVGGGPFKKNIQRYHRLKKLTIEEGFALITRPEHLDPKHDGKVMIDGARVSTKSLRLQTFLQSGLKCVYPGCTYVASFFAIERSICDADADHVKKPFHINLWGVTEDGTEVLFTHDHILARSLGGANTLDNTQTMCVWHNGMKSASEHQMSLKLNPPMPRDPNSKTSIKRAKRAKRAAMKAQKELAVVAGA